MFKAIIPTDTSLSANTNIPMNVLKNTNNDIVFNSSNNTIIFTKPGNYHIDFHIVTTDVPVGDITISESLNNTDSTVVFATSTSTAVTDFITINVPDVLTVRASVLGNVATLSYKSNVACTSTTGYVNIYRIGR